MKTDTDTEQTSLVDIEQAARKYSTAREALSAEVADLEAKIKALKLEAMPAIKKLVARAAEHRDALSGLVESAPDLFVKPRTVVFHGLKIGFRKGNGGIDWDDDARVVELIRKNFDQDKAKLLVKVTEKPIAKALAELEVAELKRIGCRVESTEDVVVIKPVDGEVEKIVNALLDESTDDKQ